MNACASGLIVTRTAGESSLGADLGAQLVSRPQALLISSGVLGVLAISTKYGDCLGIEKECKDLNISGLERALGLCPLPKGMGQYHSGHANVSAKARGLLREAVKEGQWP